jgi:hypothetical protein
MALGSNFVSQWAFYSRGSPCQPSQNHPSRREIVHEFKQKDRIFNENNETYFQSQSKWKR